MNPSNLCPPSTLLMKGGHNDLRGLFQTHKNNQNAQRRAMPYLSEKLEGNLSNRDNVPCNNPDMHGLFLRKKSINSLFSRFQRNWHSIRQTWTFFGRYEVTGDQSIVSNRNRKGLDRLCQRLNLIWTKIVQSSLQFLLSVSRVLQFCTKFVAPASQYEYYANLKKFS